MSCCSIPTGGLQADVIHERDLGKPPFVPSRSVLIDVNVNLTTTAIYDSPLTSTTPQTSPYTPLGVLHPLTRPTLTQKREKNSLTTLMKSFAIFFITHPRSAWPTASPVCARQCGSQL